MRTHTHTHTYMHTHTHAHTHTHYLKFPQQRAINAYYLIMLFIEDLVVFPFEHQRTVEFFVI